MVTAPHHDILTCKAPSKENRQWEDFSSACLSSPCYLHAFSLLKTWFFNSFIHLICGSSLISTLSSHSFSYEFRITSKSAFCRGLHPEKTVHCPLIALMNGRIRQPYSSVDFLDNAEVKPMCLQVLGRPEIYIWLPTPGPPWHFLCFITHTCSFFITTHISLLSSEQNISVKQ